MRLRNRENQYMDLIENINPELIKKLTREANLKEFPTTASEFYQTMSGLNQSIKKSEQYLKDQKYRYKS